MIEKELVKAILKNWSSFDWSLQGFGMLRLYLNNAIRLHIWDSKFSEKDVSLIHTHPWNFKSSVIAGEMMNYRFREVMPDAVGARIENYYRSAIQCGEGGGLIDSPKLVTMQQEIPEFMIEGERYEQLHNEIHASRPARGTVSIIERSAVGNPDHAYVYWRENDKFISAMPRKATKHEVREIVNHSLERWF